ncbi:MAG: putative RNA-binding protein [Mycobacterium sp.]|nr:putative RNA-binding protein [Mycobacterium sp.]
MSSALTPAPGGYTGGARMLDRAEGILVGLRRCRVESAFDEIVGASQQHVVPALRVARALVELAEGREPSDLDAAAVAREKWGHLLSASS